MTATNQPRPAWPVYLGVAIAAVVVIVVALAMPAGSYESDDFGPDHGSPEDCASLDPYGPCEETTTSTTTTSTTVSTTTTTTTIVEAPPELIPPLVIEREVPGDSTPAPSATPRQPKLTG